jgi:hypothetical protein
MRAVHDLLERNSGLPFAAATFIHCVLDCFPSLTGAFLDAANQFVFLAFDELQVVIGELREFLFQLALGNVPVSFGGERAHIIFLSAFLFLPRDSARREFLFASSVPTN